MRKAKQIGGNDAHCTDKKWGRILNIWVWKLNTAYFRDEANPALKPCPLQEQDFCKSVHLLSTANQRKDLRTRRQFCGYSVSTSAAALDIMPLAVLAPAPGSG